MLVMVINRADFRMPVSNQGGGTYFGELGEALMHQVAPLRAQPAPAAGASTAHHATRTQTSLPLPDQVQKHTQPSLSGAGQVQQCTTLCGTFTRG